MIADQAMRFGGPWTVEKLRILECYLDIYTTAMKNQPFKLMYVDPFAGGGQVQLRNDDSDSSELIRGSAERAVGITDKAFDRLIFIDKNRYNCRELEALKSRHPNRDIRIECADANAFLQGFNMPRRYWRGVIFLDPFATQVDWASIKRISEFNALDMWLLFPTLAVSRILPGSRPPDDIDPRWANRLTRIYGDESWRDLYSPSRQLPLLGKQDFERDRGMEGLLDIYRRKLRKLFGDRFLDETRTLRNSLGRPIFELLFCVGNRRGIGVARKIAGHTLDRF